jgi:hypothetical protein
MAKKTQAERQEIKSNLLAKRGSKVTKIEAMRSATMARRLERQEAVTRKRESKQNG